MQWAEKFLDQLDGALEWQSPGTMSWQFHEDENWLRMAPSPGRLESKKLSAEDEAELAKSFKAS